MYTKINLSLAPYPLFCELDAQQKSELREEAKNLLTSHFQKEDVPIAPAELKDGPFYYVRRKYNNGNDSCWKKKTYDFAVCYFSKECFYTVFICSKLIYGRSLVERKVQQCPANPCLFRSIDAAANTLAWEKLERDLERYRQLAKSYPALIYPILTIKRE